jgi:hypothetical protein
MKRKVLNSDGYQFHQYFGYHHSKVVRSNPFHGEVYKIQHKVIGFVRLVVFSGASGFLQQ